MESADSRTGYRAAPPGSPDRHPKVVAPGAPEVSEEVVQSPSKNAGKPSPRSQPALIQSQNRYDDTHESIPLLQSHDRYSVSSSSSAASPPREKPLLGEHYRWHKDELPRVRPEPHQIVRVFCGIWNLHGKKAPAQHLDEWLGVGSQWLKSGPRHHIYVIGTCECEKKAQNSLVWSSKARWEQQMRDTLGEEYFLVGAQTLSAIHIMVFLHRYLWRYCWDIQTSYVPTGIANRLGNKGGVKVGFSLGRTKVLFINAHLAAQQTKIEERTQDFKRILRDSPLRQTKEGHGVHDEYDRVFFMGDLNTRIALTRDVVDSKPVDPKKWTDANAELMENDELYRKLHSGSGPGIGDAHEDDAKIGFWPQFQEAPIFFPPTYKFDTGTDTYDTSSKRRVPAWTDRILWKVDDTITNVAYSSVPTLMTSDHRPVFGQYEMVVDLSNWTGPDDERGSTSGSSICSLQ
jgi:phosphatidylinositol-bisphosphatase